MPATLLLNLRQLSSEKLSELQHHFCDAPMATRLIGFLLAQKDEKFNTRDAVKFIYGGKAGSKDYSVFENRYYKLRKKIEDYLSVRATPGNTNLADEEKALHEAKMLLAAGGFAEAEKLLAHTEKNCRAKNIFELLPEVIDALIQARQSLNKIEENKALHAQFAEALTLYADLMEAKNLTRQVYEVNFRQGIKAAEPLYRRMAKLDRKHKEYPRFKLIYNFVAGYYKVGAGGSEYLDKTNVTNRHIHVAKMLMQKYPDMPAVHYTAAGQVTQRYRLLELQAMCYYNAMRFDEAADEMQQLYASVMQPQSPMNRMKNEILFTNAIHMLVAAARFPEALQTAQDYLKFLIVNKRHDRALIAYTEIANIHVSMFPQPSGFSAGVLLKKVNEYLAGPGKKKGDYFAKTVLLMKIKLLITMSDYRAALKLLHAPALIAEKDAHAYLPVLKKLIEAKTMKDTAHQRSELHTLKITGRKMKWNAVKPADFLHWRWIERVSEP